jgi:putative phosphoesterase
MRIAVISDTHDRVPPTLPKRLRAADEIWHLGDVCAPEALVEIEQLGPPLRVVRGNCDVNDAWPLALELEREGVRFFLTHIPPERERLPTSVQVVLHGHTHVARDEIHEGVRWLNPGALTRPRAGAASWAWLTVTHGKLTSWQTMRI